MWHQCELSDKHIVYYDTQGNVDGVELRERIAFWRYLALTVRGSAEHFLYLGSGTWTSLLVFY
jgi:hypothetical protein